MIGSTFDAQFDDDNLPDIYNAVEIDLGENGILTEKYSNTSVVVAFAVWLSEVPTVWFVDRTAVTPEHLSQCRLATRLWKSF